MEYNGWSVPDTHEPIKFDGDKIRPDLIPPSAINSLGEILAYGARKYNDRNWEKGLDYGRLYAATMRHLNAWFAGEDTDSESGMSHLSHALCCVAMLNDTVLKVKRGSLSQNLDNRPHKFEEKVMDAEKRKDFEKLGPVEDPNAIAEKKVNRIQLGNGYFDLDKKEFVIRKPRGCGASNVTNFSNDFLDKILDQEVKRTTTITPIFFKPEVVHGENPPESNEN